MFYVYNNSGWSCVVSIHDSNIKFAPPNQQGYNSVNPHPAVITFKFYDDFEFGLQIMINVTLKEYSIVSTHTSDDWISRLDQIYVWHPFHVLATDDDNQKHYEIHRAHQEPDYFFVSILSNLDSHIISKNLDTRMISTSGVITKFPVCLRLKRGSAGLISIPVNQGILCFLIQNHKFKFLKGTNTLIQIKEGEKLVIYHPLHELCKASVNYLVIPKEVNCTSIHYNRQDKRVVSIADYTDPWSVSSVSQNEIGSVCLFYAADERQNVRIDYKTNGSDYFYYISPEGKQFLSSSEGSVIKTSSIFLIEPRKALPETTLAYFILNDESLSLKGSSTIIPCNKNWSTNEAFSAINNPSEIVVDSSFMSFSFSSTLKLFFICPQSLFKLWNSTPRLPSELKATVYSSHNELIKVLPRDDISFKFEEQPGYILIEVKTTETIYHSFVLQNNTNFNSQKFKCNDFIVTSELQSHYSLGHKLQHANATFRKGWNTCIYYKRIAAHQITISNPFTSQIKITAYNNEMSEINVNEDLPQGSTLLHIKVLNPPHAGYIKIIDSCVSMCKALHPATHFFNLNSEASQVDVLSLPEFVSTIKSKKKIILFVFLFIALFLMLFLAIASWMIHCYINHRFGRRDELRLLSRNTYDYDADIRYPAPGSIPFPIAPAMQIVQPAAFQPVYPATYYLPVTY
ncbi:hypothetical protein TVAG_488860 [Trichomonas vaginalis G3]|uniref:Uncharacterized protein n=1 Tax=Trichomonas vaginalis (strain ATCC PRA-98 / G3) TaxID=412133 RepID=A2FL58_TRIV3|nr:hypothetical protein TVAGG3_0427060 [Trichomonas vaginalis G3]EAX94347.1 hypothetical protein TVAG_488860 [Trichomonas vaginalis G3]KAI5536489.1 hypothetical protein TVAGG3_0427060 [Trichomonas vaginalis G3]|eukprot:XP_001307277.1 hypothetical protein [Trichomonas vaginalis G3]